MKTKKTIFIIPGFGQQVKDEYYNWLMRFVKKKGFVAKAVPIQWNRRVMSDYIQDFKEFYKKNKTNNDYFFGFSYGAVIAFSNATELKPKKIYLCSLSPDFNEDLVYMEPWIKKLLGKNRIADIKLRSAREIAKKLSVPSLVFYGEVEGKKFPDLKKRCEETVKLAKNSKLVLVKDSPHDINNFNYVEAIKKEFK